VSSEKSAIFCKMVYSDEVNSSIKEGGIEDYYRSYTDEPHASRRKAIVKEHPEIKELFGYDWRTKYFVFAAVALQMFISTRVQNWSWPWILCVAYLVGGTIIQFLTLAIHEISHNLLFQSPFLNRIFGIFANSPLLIAYSISFRKYHLEHHKWQGDQKIDMDIPTATEGRVVGNNPLLKFAWIFTQVLFYALRPVLVKPYQPGRWEAANWAFCLSVDAIFYYFFGGWALFYLLLSLFLGLGPHPMAGHFIAEHYVFVPGVETYSYYGPLNFLGLWVGYHNEHHDFPRIPGSRLNKVRDAAPEYYDNIPHYKSWAKVLWDYVFRKDMGPYARMVRNVSTKAQQNANVDQDNSKED